MTEIVAKFSELKDEITKKFESILKSYTSTVVSAALTVAEGHEYWVVLEYGSGQAEEGPRGPMPGDDVVLEAPADVNRPRQFETLTVTLNNGTTVTSKWYPIKAREKKLLHFIDRQGVERKALVVYHPGIQARGFLRRTIRAWKHLLDDELAQLAITLGEPPGRPDVVRILNFHFNLLLEQVRAATPVGIEPTGHPHTPLNTAWGIDPAS